MRAITEQAVEAFLNGENFKKGNTEVRHVAEDVFPIVTMYLHGNAIAIRYDNHIGINNAGWQTATTKERLNGLMEYIGHSKINQRKGIWFLGEEVMDDLRNSEGWVQVR